MRLTQKQETFCIKYFELGNASEAARIALYSPKTAAVIGRENLRKPQIKVRIDELRQKAEDASVANVLERKQVLTEIVRGRFVDFMTKLTPEKLRSAALQEIRIIEYGKEVPVKTTTIKLNDSAKAIDLLNKMDKLYTEGATVNIDNRKAEVNVAYFDAREVAGAIIEAIRLGINPAILGGNGHGEDASILSSPADLQATPISESES